MQWHPCSKNTSWFWFLFSGVFAAQKSAYGRRQTLQTKSFLESWGWLCCIHAACCRTGPRSPRWLWMTVDQTWNVQFNLRNVLMPRFSLYIVRLRRSSWVFEVDACGWCNCTKHLQMRPLRTAFKEERNGADVLQSSSLFARTIFHPLASQRVMLEFTYMRSLRVWWRTLAATMVPFVNDSWCPCQVQYDPVKEMVMDAKTSGTWLCHHLSPARIGSPFLTPSILKYIAAWCACNSRLCIYDVLWSSIFVPVRAHLSRYTVPNEDDEPPPPSPDASSSRTWLVSFGYWYWCTS